VEQAAGQIRLLERKSAIPLVVTCFSSEIHRRFNFP
jgi:hypothetical protein